MRETDGQHEAIDCKYPQASPRLDLEVACVAGHEANRTMPVKYRLDTDRDPFLEACRPTLS